MLNTPFNCCYETSLDPDVALQSWYKAFTSVIDHHMPIISKLGKQPAQPKWIITGILAAMRKRDRYKKENNHVEYKIWRNKVLRQVRNSKKKFYINSIEQNKNSLKELWKHVKELCPNTKLKTPISLQINSNLISDPEIVADTLNKYFAIIANKYTPVRKSGLPPTSVEMISNFVDSKIYSEIKFIIPTVSEDFVFKQILSMPNKKGLLVWMALALKY